MESEGSKGMAMVIAGGAVLVPLLFWFLRWVNERRFVGGLSSGNGVAKLPPGCMGWPLIGEMIDFLWCFKFSRKPDDFISRRKLRYGDTGIYRTHLFGYPVIVTCSPELNKQVLGSLTEDGSFSTGWPSSQLIGNSSVAVVDGPLHKGLRRCLMQAVNSPSALDFHLRTAQPLLISALEEWAFKRKVVAFEETKAVTFRIICDALVSFKSTALLDKMESLYRGIMAGIRAMTINIPGTAFHHALKCRKELSRILLDEMRKRREEKIQKMDFMQTLMDYVDENGNRLNDVEVLDNIFSLILGGYESTSNVMTWSLYYLAKYPQILERVKEETHAIKKLKTEESLLTYEDIKKMKYTSKVVEELIRLANVSPFIFRRVVKDVVVDRYKFPKNWKVIVWIRAIHIDSKYYDDPLTFNPDRWNDCKPKAGTYSVFGAGMRYCPGNNLARHQLMMFIYHVGATESRSWHCFSATPTAARRS
ncbi:ent-kaurenoic acid oxidase 2-like isoform X2 [Dioscorea cayenensis subsp. rotundata]|uniref:Ent-kaurenoic acid oxidase 2-like isoform X2 n=1 Tax=Dioscorea cayennensis subsp. rotundata TaxID=55577 RepID=A0AB40ALE1_DIOCR|nr:ent-kaurenoic acid oxidase 2-like isoform X2 [Dioscorea cayenensis subsp. rotundata]